MSLYWISRDDCKLSLSLICKDMEKIIKSPKLADQLMALSVGQEVEISIDQFMPATIRNVTSRIAKSSQMKFEVSTMGRRYSTLVKRIA